MPVRKRNHRPASMTQTEEDAMSKDLSKYVPTLKAAKVLGVSQDHVTRLLTGGRIKGIKLGHDWLVFLPSLDRYLETKSKRGRPSSSIPQAQETG